MNHLCHGGTLTSHLGFHEVRTKSWTFRIAPPACHVTPSIWEWLQTATVYSKLLYL